MRITGILGKAVNPVIILSWLLCLSLTMLMSFAILKSLLAVTVLVFKQWLKKWIKKCDDDSETSNWIAANTKVGIFLQ